jgi:hypothetical protein
LDPSDLHHYSPLDEIVRGIQPNDMTVNRTSRHFDPNLFVVDVISTGSQLRPDYLQGQLRSWASHPSIRHFWGVSELDDRDPNCNATVGKTNDHFKKCKRELPKPTDSVVMKYFQAEYGGGTRRKPGGWLCAQVRFGQALGRVGAEYRKRMYQRFKEEGQLKITSYDVIHSVLPDSLLLVDDDTYLDVDIITRQIASELNTTMHPRAFAGCAEFDSRVNLTIPIGGFAVFLTKGSVLRLVSPIFCNRTSSRNNFCHDPLEEEMQQFQHRVCQRLKQDILNEQHAFVEGMSISDLSYELSKSAPDFCLNSDWLYGYLISYYFLSDPMPNYHLRSRSNSSDGYHLHPFLDSLMSYRNIQGACLLDSVEKCLEVKEKPFACHYQTPESMKELAAK